MNVIFHVYIDIQYCMELNSIINEFSNVCKIKLCKWHIVIVLSVVQYNERLAVKKRVKLTAWE